MFAVAAGPIPPELGKLAALQHVVLEENQLNGECIPTFQYDSRECVGATRLPKSKKTISAFSPESLLRCRKTLLQPGHLS